MDPSDRLIIDSIFYDKPVFSRELTVKESVYGLRRLIDMVNPRLKYITPNTLLEMIGKYYDTTPVAHACALNLTSTSLLNPRVLDLGCRDEDVDSEKKLPHGLYTNRETIDRHFYLSRNGRIVECRVAKDSCFIDDPQLEWHMRIRYRINSYRTRVLDESEWHILFDNNSDHELRSMVGTIWLNLEDDLQEREKRLRSLKSLSNKLLSVEERLPRPQA